MSTYDYIVVGAGSAGCLLANRLTASGQFSVLLLEAGGSDKQLFVKAPAAFSKLFKTKNDWAYHSEPIPAADGRRIFVPRGKVLGGSSSINAMLYIRGNRYDYDHDWASVAPGWSYADVLPFFKRSEHNIRLGGNAFHGDSGELTVSELTEYNPMTDAFLTACGAAGYTANNDFNGVEQIGYGPYQVTQRGGSRCSAARAFLVPAMSRSNLTVLKNVHVERVVLSGKTATGVTYQKGGKQYQVSANREVILSAGAINSPQILMLSGIGDQAQLAEHGIKTAHHLPGVGQNLIDHPFFAINLKTNFRHTLDTAETLPNLLKFLFFGKGPFTSTVAEANLFLKSDESLPAPDLQFALAAAYFVDHGFVRPKGNGFTIGACLIAPKSVGQVTLRSANPTDAPAIQPNLLAIESDMNALVSGFRTCQKLLEQPALSHYISGLYAPDRPLQTDADIRAYIRSCVEALYHPVGTCRMGTDDNAVTDPQLRVHGIANLRVVDASAMPNITRGNTNAPTIMIAERAAEFILS